MSTPITPLKAPALADLRNALQLAVTYGDKDVADSDAKQALGRIRGLVAQAIGKLGEPNKAALETARLMVGVYRIPPNTGVEWDTMFEPTQAGRRARLETELREIRDIAAAILHAAVTGDVAGSSYTDTLLCPVCEGAGRIGSIPCDQCKGAGKL